MNKDPRALNSDIEGNRAHVPLLPVAPSRRDAPRSPSPLARLHSGGGSRGEKRPAAAPRQRQVLNFFSSFAQIAVTFAVVGHLLRKRKRKGQIVQGEGGEGGENGENERERGREGKSAQEKREMGTPRC